MNEVNIQELDPNLLVMEEETETSVFPLEYEEFAPSTEDIVSDMESLQYSMQHLTEKELKLVRMIYFEGHSFAEVGRQFGKSITRVIQIHKKCLRKMHYMMELQYKDTHLLKHIKLCSISATPLKKVLTIW